MDVEAGSKGIITTIHGAHNPQPIHFVYAAASQLMAVGVGEVPASQEPLTHNVIQILTCEHDESVRRYVYRE